MLGRNRLFFPGGPRVPPRESGRGQQRGAPTDSGLSPPLQCGHEPTKGPTPYASSACSCPQDELRDAIRNQALQTSWEFGPRQHGTAGRAYGLSIIPKPPGRLHFSGLLKELRNETVLKGHIDYEVLDEYGSSLDKELYNCWVLHCKITGLITKRLTRG
eukprot:6195996-Pleurochrysis_carterae.AAC.1